MTTETRRFFESYGAAFSRTAADIAAFYFTPCITARQGAVRLNGSRAETEAFFSDVLDRYRANGCVGGDIMNFEERSVGINSAVVAVIWAYKDDDGKVLWGWTFTYNLYRSDGRWGIL